MDWEERNHKSVWEYPEVTDLIKPLPYMSSKMLHIWRKGFCLLLIVDGKEIKESLVYQWRSPWNRLGSKSHWKGGYTEVAWIKEIVHYCTNRTRRLSFVKPKSLLPFRTPLKPAISLGKLIQSNTSNRRGILKISY